jgi:hypothetical protein
MTQENAGRGASRPEPALDVLASGENSSENTPPPTSTQPATIYRGQTYYALGTEPCIRKDGKPATLMRWRSRCARCGEPFEFKRSIKTPFVPNRRCELHKRPGVRVRKLVDGGPL